MIRYHSLTSTVYAEDRFTHIKRVERTETAAYLDSSRFENPSIGIGFNLRDEEVVLPAVLNAFGLNASNSLLVTPEQLRNQIAQTLRQHFQALSERRRGKIAFTAHS
jgi:hypothetical protein